MPTVSLLAHTVRCPAHFALLLFLFIAPSLAFASFPATKKYVITGATTGEDSSCQEACDSLNENVSGNGNVGLVCHELSSHLGFDCISTSPPGFSFRGSINYYCIPNVADFLTFDTCRCASSAGFEQAGHQCVAQEHAKEVGLPPSCPMESQPLAGNPIACSNGNKVQVEVDYISVGAFPLVFQRTYNSLTTGRTWQTFPFLRNPWTFYYDRTLAFDLSTNATQVAALRSDGKAYFFHLINQVWTPDADVSDTLTQLQDSAGNLTGWVYTVAADDSVETYDATGKLSAITARNGQKHSLTHSDALTPTTIAPTSGLLIRVADAFGRQINFAYDSHGFLIRMTDPSDGVYTYTYDGNGILQTVQYPDGATRRYRYDVPWRLTGIEDENSQLFATFTYDSNGLAASTEHAGGVKKYTVSYDAAHQQSTVTDPLGALHTYSFTTVLDVSKSTGVTQPDASGSGVTTNSLTYDANGNVKTRTDFNGNLTEYAYDLTRNLETQRIEAKNTPQQRTITTRWHPTFRLMTRQSEPLRITTHVYDNEGTTCGARGALCRKTIQTTTDTTGAQGFNATPTGTPRVWRYTYNGNGQVLTLDGARTDVVDVTTYTYYANDDPDLGKRGNIATITNAHTHVTQITAYNAHGQPLRTVDPNNLVTTLTYDERQRLTSRTVGTETTTFDYDGVGQLKKVTLPDTSFMTYTYDAAHRLTDIEDSLDNKITYTLDLMGNRSKEDISDPLGTLTQTRSRVYNNLNRLIQDIGALNQTTTYGHDNQGNVKTVTDPLNHTTLSSFDALNRLSEMLDPHNGKTTTTYDGLDHLASLTDPRNLTTHYTTTGLDNLTQTISPDTGTTTNTFDRAGNLKTETDARGQKQTYTYDALNRVTRITNPVRTFTYDEGVNGLGRLTTLTDPAGVTQWRYDLQGRVLEKTHTLGTVTLTVQYRYNAVGQMHEMVLPSGKTLTYSYDTANRLQSLSVNGVPILTNMQYQPFGASKSWTWGNGRPYTRSFDLDGRIASYPLGSTTRTLSFDDASRITGFTHSDTTPSQTFDYDALDRLTRFNASSDTYTYDAVGNRTGLVLGTDNDTYTYAATSNQLANITGSNPKTYSYDAAGNTATEDSRVYTYDGRRRLTKVTEGASISRYYLNALGQRVKKSSTGQGTTRFMYDEAGHLLGEYTAAGVSRQEMVWLGDMPVAVLRGAQVYYIYADHLNTPRVITNTSNAVLWRWNHDEPFGNNAPDDDPDGNGKPFVFNLRFPGQYFDKETGLVYNYFRDYDPSTGRYVQSDPIGLDGGLNTYAYVDGNPLYWIDPLGLDLLDPYRGTPYNDFVYDITGGWGPSQWLIDVVTGFGDGASAGITRLIRWAEGIDGGVDPCSDAYQYGSWAAFALGVGRLTYAGLAKAGEKWASSDAAASEFRKLLKRKFGGGPDFRPPDLSKYKTGADLRAAAGRTNLFGNIWGAGAAGAGAFGGSGCGCKQ